MDDVINAGLNKSDTLKMIKSFIDNVEIGLYVCDYHTYEILLVNRKTADYIGVTDSSQLIGKPCWSFFNFEKKEPCSYCPCERLLDENGAPAETHVWENYHQTKDTWLKIYNQAIRWIDGRLAHMVTFYDITETKKMQEQLANLAYVDRLLQINNNIKLEQDMLQAAVKPSLVIFDITSLQKINEAFGRPIGDWLLKAVKDWIIKQNIPDSKLYRIGGDEFCITAASAKMASLKAFAGILQHRFTEPWIFEQEGNKLSIFCNASIAIVSGNYMRDQEPLLNLIERTLKAAKTKKMITIYDEKMDNEYKERLKFEFSLKRCVREDMDGFDIFYQPLVSSVNGLWCGVEALCRWNSPELGAVSPVYFVSEAERLELIETIGMWVLENAIINCKKMGLDEHEDFILDVNVSSVQFMDETLADKILNILRTNDYPGEKLCLEITESTQFTFTDQSLNTINRLRANQILVALDDFGTGYSNFNNLKNLPVDFVKIERAFVMNIEHDEYHQYLFRSMSELTHTVSLRLIAEGVENNAQKEILIKNGADYLQGYLFNRPLSYMDLEKQKSRFVALGES